MRFLILLLLVGLTSCAFRQSQKLVRGTITRVQHRPDFERNCGIILSLKDKNACDVPPVCCAYRITVKDADGHEERFYAFWPKFAPGILGLVQMGDTATFHLHLRPLVEFPCSQYGCRTGWEYMLDADEDVKVEKR